MSVDGTVIARAIDRMGAAPRVLAEAFGTDDPEAVATAVNAFCERHLGARLAAYELFAGGVGTVHGVRLADGRRVAIKVHRADLDVAFLRAVQQVQRAVADAGMPAPRPLLLPTPLAHGLAMVEELFDRGTPVPAHDAAQRGRMAADLHRFVALATACRPAFGEYRGGLTGLGEALFPAPHDRRFDLAKPGAEWIDRIAESARATLRAWRGPVVVGHADWRVENLRYDAGALSAIYDWDSLVVRPEAALVGAVAGIFSIDWTQRDVCRVPREDEVAAFVADYERARRRPFTAKERELARAAFVYQAAYLARCQWSDPLPPTG